jgi:uncharacterized protein YndB with AHSA1/START domain
MGRTAVAAGEALVVEWTFEAPRDLVWAAWTEPERFVRWWGPRGFTTPYVSIDLRRGGEILYCMRSERNGDIWAGGVFQEVDPPERLVFTDYFADENGNPVSPESYGMSSAFPSESLITVIFDDDGGKTKLTLTHTIPATAPEQAGAREGWSESFERLASELASATDGGA